MGEGKTLVGVDIGASAIKVVQVKESKKRLQVVRYGFAPLPPQTIIDGHIMSSGVVIEALQRIFHDCRITQKEVAIGVYGQSVIVRKITVPMMTPAELEKQIGWEAEQHIPFDIKVMSVDYEVLKRRPEAGQMDMMLVAAKRDEINDYAAVLREARLKPLVVDINAFTVQNIYERHFGLPEDRTIALINVGASVTTVNVISRGISAFTREVANAGNSVTEQIQRQCGVPYDQAEAYKYGGGPTQVVPQEIQQVIEGACDSLAGEIQRSLDFYMATSGEGDIHQVVLSGGSAYLTPLQQAVERRARVAVQVFDPMANVAVDAARVNEADLRARSAQLAVAMGLALRREREQRA